MRRIPSFTLKQLLLAAIAIDLMLLLAGCTTSWVGEASAIIALLGPAIASALGILSAFGKGVPTSVMTEVNAWSQQAQTALTQVANLINEYNTAEATAQPGILAEIQSALEVVSSSLTTLLPTIHITDAATQAKIVAIFDAVGAEVAALINLIPVIKGTVTDHDQAKELLGKLKSAKQFKSSFNAAAGSFGKQYTIK